MSERIEVAIVGGGFYGACLALFAASVARRVVLFEREPQLLQRASYSNQARVHTGFHYPRSFLTALRSLRNYPRFARDFEQCVRADFTMLYAVARRGSKVGARRFEQMFRDMGAPFRTANAQQRALFDPAMVEDVYACVEYAFDAESLRGTLGGLLEQAGVQMEIATEVVSIDRATDGLHVVTSDGIRHPCDEVFNCTYSSLNRILKASGCQPIGIKHEMTEIALVTPPEELVGYGVTVMDGAFFSTMPFPARDAYSLTHVRYTPHAAWADSRSGNEQISWVPRTRWRHMVADASRYVPCLAGSVYRESLFETKTVPLRNEIDDGRPILFRAHAEMPGLYSVLGSKIDNVYDLFTAVAGMGGRWAHAELSVHC